MNLRTGLVALVLVLTYRAGGFMEPPRRSAS